MSNLFGIELDNPTANTVEVGLFELGASESQKIYNGVLAISESDTVSGSSTFLPVYFQNQFLYFGDLTEINTNINQYVTVDSADVRINSSSSYPFNPSGGRYIQYSDGSTDTVLQSLIAIIPLTDWCDEVVSVFETKVGETNVISVTPISKIMWNGVAYTLKVNFEISYLVSDNYISSTATFLTISTFVILNTFQTFSCNTPTSSSSLTGSWTSTYSTINGIIVRGTTGDDYGQLLRGQASEPMAINSMRVTPLESITYDESSRISQCLQPIKFTRINSDGNLDTFVLNPTVDLYQSMTTLDYINLGSRTDDFPLDGNTRFSYTLLPFASVSFQFDYIEISNFVFANRELVKEIVERNKQRNKRVEYLSKISKEYQLKIK